jgi:endonuclease/exonuclease/phosphatase (EEP) superfamily protein YafD
VAVTALAVSLLLTGCRLLMPSPRVLVMVTAFVPWALVGYAVAVVAWWLVHRLRPPSGQRPGWAPRIAVLVAFAGLGLHLAWLVPSVAGAHASGRPDLVVMTSNLRLGQADTSEVARVAVAQHVDVLVAEEVTTQALASLSALRDRFPYVVGQPAPDALGTVVFSRYPVTDVARLPVTKGTWQLRVEAPTPFWFVGVHTAQPLNAAAWWRRDHARLLSAVRALDGPVVLAGDFNATLDLRPMRRLVAAGFSDSARQANSGWQPTWPSAPDAAGALPFGLRLLTLDHVLVDDGFSTISTSTYEIDRSDHRALVARLALASTTSKPAVPLARSTYP